MEKEIKVKIDTYGYDIQSILKQNQEYVRDEDKAKYLENAATNIYETIRTLRLVYRYATITANKIRKIGSGEEKVALEEFIEQVKLSKKNELAKRDIEKIFHSIVPEVKKVQHNIFWNFHEIITNKYFDTNYEMLVMDYFHNVNEDLTYGARLFRYKTDLREKWEALYDVYLKVKKEFKKYKTIDSFRLNNEAVSIELENKVNKLRTFQRGELQLALELYIKEYNLETGEPVSSGKVRIITRKLVKEGWDAKETSVAEAFRKMGFVKGRRK